MQWELRFSAEPPRIAIFVSRLDHCLIDLLHRHSIGELQGQIMAIVSNHEVLRPVAERYHIPYHVFHFTPDGKRAQEKKEIELLKSAQVTLVILARYMRIFSKQFVNHYPN